MPLLWNKNCRSLGLEKGSAFMEERIHHPPDTAHTEKTLGKEN